MIEVKSPAKINLYLNIISKLDNGYHEIESAFQIIDLCDVIRFYPNATGICINSNEDIKLEENIIFKSACLLNSFTNQNNSIQIELDKKIPMGAGLGGGSSNAASTLIALNKIWDLNLKQSELMKLGKKLGSDVPFFINGTNAFVGGIGEKIKEKESIDEKVVLIYPEIHCSSAFMYKKFDDSANEYEDNSQNSFWGVYRNLFPEINNFYINNISDVEICLSGSGSCMFIRYKNDEELEKILKIIPPRWRFFLTKPLQYMPLSKEFKIFGV
jgi:4-diphosphocytidyl-2-C-methyl-D-erythritol kinase